MSAEPMSAAEVLAAIDGMLPEEWDAGLQEPSAAACDRLASARTAVAALIARVDALEAASIGRDLGEVHALIAENAALTAERDALEAENRALRDAYHKARNAAAGFSNYCDESASARRCEKELAEAERMFRDIGAARAEAICHG